MHHSMDILGLGCAAVDDIIHVDQYPPADRKVPIIDRQRRCGGLTAAALIAAARLGADCAYAGCLGENEPSNFVRESLAEHGVTVEFAHIVPDARPVTSIIVVDRMSGSRNIFFDLNGLVELPVDWPDEQAIRGAKALLVDHFNVKAQLRAARIAREASIPVIADFESRSHPDFFKLLELVDHLIVSQTFAQELTGYAEPCDAALGLWHPGRVAVVVTCGAEGCWYVTRSAQTPKPEDSTTVRHQPSFPVQAVDTTGCGDVFHGAYAVALVRNADIASAVCFASATAALKASREGGVAQVPRIDEVYSFMEAKRCPINS